MVIVGGSLLLIAGFYGIASYNEDRATIFHPEQLVRVYSPEGRYLLSGEVRFEEDQYVTLCKLQPIALSGVFTPRQCLTLNMFGPFLLIEAKEKPGVKWSQYDKQFTK
jgi:hypothetical protein